MRSSAGEQHGGGGSWAQLAAAGANKYSQTTTAAPGGAGSGTNSYGQHQSQQQAAQGGNVSSGFLQPQPSTGGSASPVRSSSQQQHIGNNSRSVGTSSGSTGQHHGNNMSSMNRNVNTTGPGNTGTGTTKNNSAQQSQQQIWQQDSRLAFQKFEPAIGRASQSGGEFQLNTSSSSSHSNHRHTNSQTPYSAFSSTHTTSSRNTSDATTLHSHGQSLTWDSQTFARSGLSSRLGGGAGTGTLFSNPAHGPLEDVDETVAKTPTEQRQRMKLQDLFTQPAGGADVGMSNSSTDASFTKSPPGLQGDSLTAQQVHQFSNLTSNSDTVSSVQSLPVVSSMDLQSLFNRPPVPVQSQAEADNNNNSAVRSKSPPGLSFNATDRAANARRGSTGMHIFNRGFDSKVSSAIGKKNPRARVGSNESEQSIDSFFGAAGTNSNELTNMERNNLTLPLPDRSSAAQNASSSVLLADLFGPQLRRPNSTGHLLAAAEDDPIPADNEAANKFRGASFLQQQRNRGFAPIGTSENESAPPPIGEAGEDGEPLARHESVSAFQGSNPRKALDLVREDSNGYNNGTPQGHAAGMPMPGADYQAPPSSVTVPITATHQSTQASGEVQQQHSHSYRNQTTNYQQQYGAPPEQYNGVAYGKKPQFSQYANDLSVGGGMASLHLGPSVMAPQQQQPPVAAPQQPQLNPAYMQHPDPHYSPYAGAVPAPQSQYSPHHSPYHSPHVTGMAGPPMMHHTAGHSSPQYYNHVAHSVYGHVVGSPHMGPHAAPPYISSDPYAGGQQHHGQGQHGAPSPHLAPMSYPVAQSQSSPLSQQQQGMYNTQPPAPQMTYTTVQAPQQQQQQQHYTMYHSGAQQQQGQYVHQAPVPQAAPPTTYIMQSQQQPQSNRSSEQPQQYVVVQQTPGGKVVLAPAATLQGGNNVMNSTINNDGTSMHNGDHRRGGRGGGGGGGHVQYQHNHNRGGHNVDGGAYHHQQHNHHHTNHHTNRGHFKPQHHAGQGHGHGGRNGMGHHPRGPKPGAVGGYAHETEIMVNDDVALSLLEEFKRSHRSREWTVQNNVKGKGMIGTYCTSTGN
jgi:hypothetical protein